MEANKIIVERIMNAVHKCLQWQDGEIAGIDIEKLEQQVTGIINSKKPDWNKIGKEALDATNKKK